MAVTDKDEMRASARQQRTMTTFTCVPMCPPDGSSFGRWPRIYGSISA